LPHAVDFPVVHRSLGAQPAVEPQAACVACHKKHDDKVTAEDLQARVYQIQDRHWALRERRWAAVVSLIDDLKAAKAAGRKDADLLAARYMQRRSQFYWTSSRRKIPRIPCAAGSARDPGRIDRLRAPGPDRPARPALQADRARGQHSATPAGEALRRYAGISANAKRAPSQD
jgi:hypothetical protein